ncbi:MAG: glycosyltransferase family 2 protein [Kutzneria sp.]|nr:glycosyltransferase family 2 protein [Kutzneria sp.]
MTRVLVAVVTHDSTNDLPALLASIEAGMSGVDQWRLVVADNASTDGSVDLVRELLPSATVVETGANLGYAAGINACACLAEPTEDLLVLNADVCLSPGCVLELVRACESGAIGVAVPVVFRGDGEPEPTLRRKPTVVRVLADALLGARAGRLGEELAVSELRPHGPTDADWANGAVLFIPASVRTSIGPWREDLFLYSEEVDYCRRVVDAGWRVCQVPGATATHRGGDVTRSPALWAQLTTNKVVHMARWEGQRAAAMTWAILVAAQLLRLPLRRGTHRRALLELLRGRRKLVNGVPTNPAAPKGFAAHVPAPKSVGGHR